MALDLPGRITERMRFRLLIMFLLFLVLAFDRDVGLIYIAMIIGDFLWWRTDKKADIVMERKPDRVRSVVMAFGAYVVFFAASVFITKVFSGATGLQSVLGNIASTTPILKGSNVLTYLGWGVVIPLIESPFMFGRVFEGVLEMAHVNPARPMLNGRVWFVIFLVAAVFALFHISSKDLNSAALMTTFVFAVISMYLVVKERQLMAATILHIFTNSTAVLYIMRPEVFSFLGGFL